MSNSDSDNYYSLDRWIADTYGPPRKKKFSDKQKAQLRPIAEVLALLDGNAFFGVSVDDNGQDTWYEQYLPEAWMIFKTNGGESGWVSQTSWMKDLDHENETVRDAYNNWRLLKILSKKT